MKFLRDLYKEIARRMEEGDEVVGLNVGEPVPSYFGLRSFAPYPDLLQKLLDHEEQLSEGTLRDIVHLSGALREVVHSTSDEKKQEMVDELIAWLDKLPQIEREIFADKIQSWMRHSDATKDEPAFHKLFYESVQRPPPTFGSLDNNQELSLLKYPHQMHGFKAYNEQRAAKNLKDQKPDDGRTELR